MKVLVKTVTEWVKDLVIISLVFAFIEMLLPANDLQRFARVVVGIVMIAVIVGSIVDISGAMDSALQSQAGFALSQAATQDAFAYARQGDLLTKAGLEIAVTDTEKKVVKQVEAIARLAGGVDKARAEIKLAASGDIKRIDLTLGTGDFKDRAGPGSREVAEAREKRVIDAIRDFYGFSGDVEIFVR